jgi:iron complex outermembrane receptor protein
VSNKTLAAGAGAAVSNGVALRRLLIGATALTGFGLSGGAVLAQTTTTATPAANQVEEVIVTAQRRAERLQDVPISVTAVNAQALARAHIDDASRLEYVAPGLTWGQQGSDSFPAIRGVRTSLVSAQNDPVIGFYIDGIYQSRTQQQSIPLFDISRVEVQRGPQGTLYGRNTFGGNLSVITAEPTNVYEGGVTAEAGNYNSAKVEGFVNIPVSDDLSVRISGVHVNHNGYVHSTYPGVVLDDDNENAGRINLKWTPTSKLDVDLHLGHWQRDDAGAGSYGYKVAGTLINPNTGYQSVYGVPYAVNPSVHNGTDIVHGVDIGVPVTGGAWTNDWDYQPFEHVQENYVSATVSYDLGPVILRSISGYTDFRADRSADNDQSSVLFADPAAGFGTGVQEPDTRDHTFTEEVQLASKSSTPLQWIIGGYYLNDNIHELYQQEISASVGSVPGYKETTALQTDAYAAYAQAYYFIVPDQLRIIGGVRYSEESKKFAFADYADGDPGTYNFHTPYSQTAGDPSFSSTTWRAGLEYTPTHHNMVYATVSTGFESGGVNDTGGSPSIPSSYAPQTVTAYEVGTKDRFLDGKVQVDLALFRNDFRNLQINVYTPQVSYFGSAGQAYSEGGELSVFTLPAPNFHIDLTATSIYAVYTKYISGNNFYGASNGTDPVSVNLAGKYIPMSPKLKTTLAAYYDFDLGEKGVVTPYVSWLYSSSYYTTDFNTSLDEQKAFSVVDLSLRWTAPTGKLYIEGFGNNVTNVPVLYSAVIGRDERIQVSYGPPATYGARIGVKF